MYNSLIELLESPIHDVIKQMNEEKENYIYQCVADIGVNIDKSELIKALQYDRDQYEQGYRDGKQISQWISVKDRLPDNDSTVLCWYEYRAMDGTHEGEMIQKYGIGYYFKGWCGEVSCGCDARVIAWMPLPAPPTEKE